QPRLDGLQAARAHLDPASGPSADPRELGVLAEPAAGAVDQLELILDQAACRLQALGAVHEDGGAGAERRPVLRPACHQEPPETAPPPDPPESPDAVGSPEDPELVEPPEPPDDPGSPEEPESPDVPGSPEAPGSLGADESEPLPEAAPGSLGGCAGGSRP